MVEKSRLEPPVWKAVCSVHSVAVECMGNKDNVHSLVWPADTKDREKAGDGMGAVADSIAAHQGGGKNGAETSQKNNGITAASAKVGGHRIQAAPV